MQWASSSAFLASMMLAACASSPPSQQMTSSTQGATLSRSGQITDVRDLAVQNSRNTGLGSMVGAVLGGIAGSTIGSGNGSTVAGIGGAVAGGMAGQHVEQSGGLHRMTEVSVRFDNGDIRTYRIEPSETLRVGDKVTVTTGPEGTRVARQ